MTSVYATSCLNQFLLSILPSGPSKNGVGEGKKGRVGCPCPGLPYLSDQPLPFSFRFLSLAWRQPQFPPFSLLEKVSSLAGCGPVLERGW